VGELSHLQLGMWCAADHSRHAAIEVPAHGYLFGSGLRMISTIRIFISAGILAKLVVRRPKRAIDGAHKRPALEDSRQRAESGSSLAQVQPVAGYTWGDNWRARSRRPSELLIQISIDLFLSQM